MRESPPEAPEIDRRLRLRPSQWLGFAALAVLPILAVTGIVDEKWATRTATGDGVRLEVDYPARAYNQLSRPLQITVANTGATSLARVEVEITAPYLDGFVDAAIAPAPENGAYVVALDDGRPGESREVRVNLMGQSPGRHRGQVIARAGGAPAQVAIESLVLP
jgi:hypothetical protein